MTQAKQQDKIQEIMWLVERYAEGIRQGIISEAQGDGFNQGCADFSKEKLCIIQSKLRELVREPLDIAAVDKEYSDKWSFFDSEYEAFVGGVRYAERAHSITSASGVE